MLTRFDRTIISMFSCTYVRDSFTQQESYRLGAVLYVNANMSCSLY